MAHHGGRGFGLGRLGGEGKEGGRGGGGGDIRATRYNITPESL